VSRNNKRKKKEKKERKKTVLESLHKLLQKSDDDSHAHENKTIFPSTNLDSTTVSQNEFSSNSFTFIQ